MIVKNSGIINFETLNNGECIGSFNFIEKKELVLFCSKNNTTAYGEIFIKDNIIEGSGFDKKKNKIRFVSKRIDE